MKKKIFIIALVICVVVLSIASVSTAYFTDVDEKTNTFTAGNVDIKFEGDVFVTLDDTTVYPSQKLGDSAKVLNVGSEDAFVGVIISFNKDIGGLEKVSALFEGLVAQGTDYSVKYDSTSYKLYIVKNEKLVGQTGTATLFNSITIPATWDNAQMTAFNGVSITVKAYATQTVGFATNDAETALTTAFADWAAYSTLA